MKKKREQYNLRIALSQEKDCYARRDQRIDLRKGKLAWGWQKKEMDNRKYKFPENQNFVSEKISLWNMVGQITVYQERERELLGVDTPEFT